MKVLVFVFCIACIVYVGYGYVGVLSAAVLARDLGRIAQQERARRDALPASERGAKSFTDAHLESYGWQRRPAKLGAREASPPSRRDLDMAKAEAFWRRQKMQHDRDLARIEARIRRLQSRLAQRELVARGKDGAATTPPSRSSRNRSKASATNAKSSTSNFVSARAKPEPSQGGSADVSTFFDKLPIH